MKLEKTLVEMVGHFTPARASDWLRILFSSFETDAEPIAVDATKNESAYFAEARRIGWVAHLPEIDSAEATNKPLVVVAVKMKGDLTERTSRLVQFAFAKKVIQNAIARGGRGIHGLPTQGLFFFYDADGYFRISLVHGEADGRKLKYNSAKRQSFYVDPTAANNILRRRLGDAIKTFAELKNAFSVEQLTKEFYGRLFEWYTWALAPGTGVTFPNDLADEKDNRKYNHEAIIRLITRLMFTWFIRQKIPALKGLFVREGLDEILKGNRGKGKFDPDSMEDDNYYRCILQNLFFATFNCPQSGKGKLLRRWIDAKQDENGDGWGLSNDFNVTTVYRYRNEFKNPDAFLEDMRSVPFLNCALFDCLDKAERKQDGGRKLYFDGFSTKIKRQAHVPNGLFFKEGCGLIDLFNGYEFTIDENSADDADVALDPELLGKVFENLLGAFNPETQETARKATGSFYTPREIVDYMVEESLKNYLKGRLPETTRDIDAKLDDLFDRTKAAEGERTLFSRKDEETLLDALYDCKVLDPACGSGAFPMGVLHCMVRLLARLDPDSISIRERLIARYRVDKDSVDPTETAEDRRERLAELEKCLDEGQHYPDYARKLYLIENCIYGVDIQPIATQISKLRFFISLLCDQFRTSFNGEDANYGLLALPNLEAKFVCANTLISLPETSGELDLTASGVMDARQRLKINRHRIFGARSTGTKEKYKKRDLEIRDEIRDAVVNALARPDESIIAASTLRISELLKERKNFEMPRMVKQRKKVAKPLQQFSLFDALSPVKGKQEFEEEIEVLVDENESKRQSIDLQISIERMKIAAEQEKANTSNVTAAEAYAALVAGWDPFDQNASSGFFDPEWMFNITNGFDVVIGNPPYGLVNKRQNKGVSIVVDDDILCHYKEASEYEEARGRGSLNIYRLFVQKSLNLLAEEGVCIEIFPLAFAGDLSAARLRQFVFSKYRALSFDAFPERDNPQKRVFEAAKMSVCILAVRNAPSDGDMRMRINLDRFIDGGGGCFLVAANAFQKLDPEYMRLPIAGEMDYQILLKVRNNAHRLIEVGRCATGEMDMTFAKTAFTTNSKFPEMLRGAGVGRYEIREELSQGEHLFIDESKIANPEKIATLKSHERLIMQGITGVNEQWRLKATLAKDVYCANSTNYIAGLDNIHFLLGLFNSKLMNYFFAKFSTNSNVNGYEVDELPLIPSATPAEQEALSSLVDLILAAKEKDSNADTSAFEAEIDQLVYQLYGLTGEEIAIVEGRNETKQEPQGENARRPTASPRRRKQATTPAPPEPTDDEVLE